MNRLTPVFLVLLRLAIGWHILFEGVAKLNDPSWTSAGYLQQSAGPLAEPFQSLSGDPVLDRMAVIEVAPGQDATNVSPRDRMPPRLAYEWQTYFDRFANHYDLQAEQRQDAENKFHQRQDQTTQWLIQGKKKVTRETQFGSFEEPKEQTTPERLRKYRDALDEVRRLQAGELTLFREGASAKLSAARAEANRIRAELQADLDEQTLQMKQALQAVLNEEQKNETAPMPAYPGRWQVLTSLEWLGWSRLDWADWIVRYGLPIVGACLLLGLFTRSACVAGAVFLLLFYLPLPPWPGLPVNPRAEGTYLFVSKNVIEMMALLLLATTRSGRWVGLDALFQFCCRGRRKEEVESAPVSEPEAVEQPESSPEQPEEEAEDPSARVTQIAPREESTEKAPPPVESEESEEAPTGEYQQSEEESDEPSTIIHTPKEPSHGD